MPSRLFDFLYTAILSVLFFVLFQGAASRAPYQYDEADYMIGARLGLAANYLDTNSLGFPDFVNTGVRAYRREISRQSLSEYIRNRRDPMFYRHFHGPVNAFWLVLARTAGGDGEHWMRAANLSFHVLSFLTIYWGILWVFGTQFRLAAVAASAAYLCCVNNILAMSTLSSHAPFLFLSILTLFAIARFAAMPSPGRYYTALILCAISLCALEYAVLLLATLGCALFSARGKFFASWERRDWLRFARNSLLCVAATIAVLWPSGIFKLTLAQGFAFIIYLTASRAGSFGSSTPLEIWRLRFHQIPLDMAVLSLSVALSLLLIWRSPLRRVLLPFLLYASLLGLTTLKNTSDASRYISSMFAPWYVCGAVLAVEAARRVPSPLKWTGVTLLAASMIFVSSTEVQARTMGNAPDDTEAVLAWMSARPVANVLMPFIFVPALQYYYPRAVVRSYPPDTSEEQITAEGPRYDGYCLYVGGSAGSPSAAATGRLECIANR